MGGIIAIHGSLAAIETTLPSAGSTILGARGRGGCSEYRILRGLPLLRAAATLPFLASCRRRCRRLLINLDILLPLVSGVASWQDGRLGHL